MTIQELEILNTIESYENTIDMYHRLKGDKISTIGGWNKFIELYVERFKLKLEDFVKQYPIFSNYDFWKNDKLDCYCCSFNFDENEVSDYEYDALLNLEDEVKYDAILFTSNHSLF